MWVKRDFVIVDVDVLNGFQDFSQRICRILNEVRRRYSVIQTSGR